jgi:hypothetical protein
MDSFPYVFVHAAKVIYLFQFSKYFGIKNVLFIVLADTGTCQEQVNVLLLFLIRHYEADRWKPGGAISNGQPQTI